MKQTIGIDVSKEEIVIYMSNNFYEVKNDKKSINAFLKKHREELSKIDLIIFEATGGYERCLRDCLIAKSLPYHIAHPNHVRNYAKSQGYLAKTDKIDAKVIAEYGAHSKQAIAEKPLPSKEMQQLKLWMDRREQLVKDNTRESNRLQQEKNPEIKKSIKRHMKWLKQEMESLEAEMDLIEKQNEALHHEIALADSVPGIGKQTARAIVTYLPEIKECDEKTVAALAGLAPLNNDSGKHQGKRSIKGGRSSVRRVLYMAAMSAAKTNSAVKPLFDRLTAKGKLYKVAITAVMRKLLLIVQSILKRQTMWIEKKI